MKNYRGVKSTKPRLTGKPDKPAKPAKPKPAKIKRRGPPKEPIQPKSSIADSPAKAKRSPLTPSDPLALAFSSLQPSWRCYLEFVALAAKEGDKEMQKVMYALGELPSRKRDIIMPVELCDLAGIKPSDLIGAVCSQVWKVKGGTSTIISAVMEPEVITAIGRAALDLENGHQDRKLFVTMTGKMPDKKGTAMPAIAIYNNPQAIAAAAGTVQPGILPDMHQDVIELDRLLDEPLDAIDVESLDSTLDSNLDSTDSGIIEANVSSGDNTEED